MAEAEVSPAQTTAALEPASESGAPAGSPTGSPLQPEAPATRPSSRARLLALLFLTTTLVFAGLWMRQVRLGFEQVSAIRESMQQASAVQSQLKTWQGMLYQRQEALKQADTLVGMMAEPKTPRWLLSGAEGRGQAFHDPEHHSLALFTFDLKAPESGKGYQAWGLVRDGAPASLGMLPDPTEGVRSLLVPAPTGELTGVQVTLEPATGSAEPGGPVVLAGEVAR